jgi:WD40 repeat protein
LSAVPALCLAPDGWHLLSGGRDKVVCVWDIRNGSRVATLPVYEALEGMSVQAGRNWNPTATTISCAHSVATSLPAVDDRQAM